MKTMIFMMQITCILVGMSQGAPAQIPFTRTPVDVEFGDGRPFDIVIAFIDNDTEFDIVADVLDLAGADDYISWYENLSPGYSEVIFDTLESNAGNIALADLDSDLDNDIVLCTQNETIWYQNDGNANFTQGLVDPFEASRLPVVSDLNDDMYQDVIVLAPYGISWAMNDGNENFTHLPIETSPIVDNALVVTDLDDDLDKDIVSSLFIDSDSHLVWYDNDGSESFTRTSIDTLTGLADISDLVVDDLDEDGDKDLVLTLADDDLIIWLENDGSENFTRQPVAEDFVQAPRRVVVVDIDNDLDKDLLVLGGNSAIGEIVYYENDGGETFTKRIIDNSVGNRRNVAVVDLDDDGDLDFFAVNNFPHEISYYRNELIPTAIHEQGAKRFTLQQNYPNPFNPQTTVKFTLSRTQHVKISIFDLAGRPIALLADRTYDAGSYSTVWKGQDASGQAVPSGAYVVRMETEGFVESQKIMLVR